MYMKLKFRKKFLKKTKNSQISHLAVSRFLETQLQSTYLEIPYEFGD